MGLTHHHLICGQIVLRQNFYDVDVIDTYL
jgi:hypothetical protein